MDINWLTECGFVGLLLMKANIQGISVEGTTEEIAELIKAMKLEEQEDDFEYDPHCDCSYCSYTQGLVYRLPLGHLKWKQPESSNKPELGYILPKPNKPKRFWKF